MISFAPLDPNVPVFFGFGEYLSSLALMVLAWTIADDRYRFRISSAPLPMSKLTFGAVAVVGALTLLTDVWRAQAWPMLVGPIPPAVWQGMLGGTLLVTFLAWAWFGFIRPPIYGKLNAERYAQTLYRTILKGSPPELSIAADELSRSAKAIVHHASNNRRGKTATKDERREITAYADDILLLIADRRFCRAIVASSPNTIGALFHALRESKKYGIPIGPFARNVMREAIANRDSFVFHESSGYDSGLLGYHKPLTTIMFSDIDVVEGIGTLLDPGYFEAKDWTPDQWGAYSRLVLMSLRAFAERGVWWGQGRGFHAATELLNHAVSDLYKLNGLATPSWDDDTLARLRVVTGFIKDAIKILEETGVPEGLVWRIRERFGFFDTFYDELADLISEVVFAASAVTSPRDLCWWIQHNSVWAELTWLGDSESATRMAVLFKVRRLLYDDITELSRFPNFKGARILGLCINVMGFSAKPADHRGDMLALHKAVLAWTRSNYAKLRAVNSRVADACLVDGITYDEENSRLVRTYPADGLRLTPHFEYFPVDKPVSLSELPQVDGSRDKVSRSPGATE